MRFALLFLSLLFISSASIAQTTLVKVIFIIEDFDTHKGIAGALVTVRQTASTQPTLADGKVTFNNVPVGEIEYFIMKEGYQFETGRVNVSTEEKTNIFRTPISKIDDKKILVTGEVTDGEGRDVKDAWVEVKIADQVRTVMTDASGNYSADIAPSAKFPSSTMRIEVKKGDCKKAETVDIPRTNVVYKDFKLECKGDHPPPPLPKNSKFTSGDLTFELMDCKQLGQIVKCEFIVRSTGKDVDLQINVNVGTARIIDGENGNEYNPKRVSIANKTAESGHASAVYGTIVTGYPTKVVAEFKDVFDPISIISKLEIEIGQKVSGGSLSWDKIEFKDVRVSK